MADDVEVNGAETAEAAPKAAPKAEPAKKPAAAKREPKADDTAADIVEQLRNDGYLLDGVEDKPEGEKPEAKSEEKEEPKEDEPAKKAGEDDEAAEKSEKQSTYQKNKRRLEEARRERDEARRLAEKAAAEAAEIRAENEYWRRQVEAERGDRDRTVAEARQGRLPSAEDREIVELRRQLSEFQEAQRIAQERAQYQQRLAFERAKNAERDRLRQELDEVEHLGVDRQAVLREYVLSAEVGREESIGTIAKRQAEMLAFQRARQAEDAARSQAARSGSAPPISRGQQPRAAAGPKADDDAAVIAAYLRAEGYV